MNIRNMLSALMVLVVAAVLAACGSGTPLPASSTMPPSGASAAKDRPYTVTATVNTLGAGCVVDTGDCWLPPYPQPALTGTPLYAQTGVNPCRETADTNWQKNCWPQPYSPYNKVTLVCQVQGPAQNSSREVGYFGFVVPTERNPAKKNTVAFNQRQWFEIDPGQDVSRLPTTCPAS